MRREIHDLLVVVSLTPNNSISCANNRGLANVIVNSIKLGQTVGQTCRDTADGISCTYNPDSFTNKRGIGELRGGSGRVLARWGHVSPPRQHVS